MRKEKKKDNRRFILFDGDNHVFFFDDIIADFMTNSATYNTRSLYLRKYENSRKIITETPKICMRLVIRIGKKNRTWLLSD